jgi:hypothetical protein
MLFELPASFIRVNTALSPHTIHLGIFMSDVENVATEDTGNTMAKRKN